MIRDNFLNHWITGKALTKKVFDTLFYDSKKGVWTKIRPDVKECRCKYDEYFMIDGERYNTLHEAKEAMLTTTILDIAFEKPIIPYVEEEKLCEQCHHKEYSFTCGLFC